MEDDPILYFGIQATVVTIAKETKSSLFSLTSIVSKTYQDTLQPNLLVGENSKKKNM